MAFSEKLKKEVRMKADGKCVICHKPFVEVHHIIPQAENGPDTIDNAVPVCAYCHDLFGANPTKRKQLKEMRDSWYKVVEASKTPRTIEKHYVHEKTRILTQAEKREEPMVAIYHVVYENEDFNDAAKAIIELTKKAQVDAKNHKRALYLDIDGHRLKNGAFDHDMWELQFNFILQNLFYYYTEIHLPLVTVYNPYKQIDDPIPGELIIIDNDDLPEDLKPYEGTILLTSSESIKNQDIKS